MAALTLGMGLVAPRAHAQSVADAVASMGPCQSHLVSGLSDQLLRAQVCAYPDSLVAFSHPNIHPVRGVNQYGSPEMVAALLSVAASNDIVLNDAFRTVVVQYAYVATDLPGGSDGCYYPAAPGTSRHEWGNAVDVENYDALRGALGGAGFAWAGSDDPVHFTAGPERHGSDVLTFQHLWNLNHPTELIDEDGVYGPQTEGALRRSPAAGFAIDGCALDRDGDGSPEGADCDDADANRHPAATETCDGHDDDCDARIDEGVMRACGETATCAPGTQTCNGGVWGVCAGVACDTADAGAGDGSVGDGGVALVRRGVALHGGCAVSGGMGVAGSSSGAPICLIAALVLIVTASRRRKAR